MAVSKAIETVSKKRRPGGVSRTSAHPSKKAATLSEGVDALAEADATIRRQQDRLNCWKPAPTMR